MTQASDGNTVQINYTGKLTDGTVFDSSEGRDPLEFQIGGNTIIPTLEAAVVGMAVGDKATVEIAAADAYGPRQPEAVQTVERSMIADGGDVEIGSQLQATAPGGEEFVLTVTAIDEKTVTLDGNHPLAGEDLVFDIELVAIKDAA